MMRTRWISVVTAALGATIAAVTLSGIVRTQALYFAIVLLAVAVAAWPEEGEEAVMNSKDAEELRRRSDAIVATCNAAPELTRIAMTDERVDSIRQCLQVILSEADNIRARLGKLGVSHKDITESQLAIERNVERIAAMLREATAVTLTQPQLDELIRLSRGVQCRYGSVRPRIQKRLVELGFVKFDVDVGYIVTDAGRAAIQRKE